ncbi:MAG: LysR family transcriptional regulator [Rhodobacteraceae bacterium]|jgi:aminoethylphosphonate catabolism LysR family transcriptional regulator|nr:MAG: LysR family transcriptional regulator [Paracoccaceae bacterium]|tara:strand:- start:95 stop:955 length:861 start_codon:yes stop_codon:yes gene_type:complete
MTYSQLRAFHCVATYGGFSKAAEKTQHSQPVLSGHVKQLEEFYDNLLFKREKKRISLTSAGKELFILTKQFFEVEEQINNHLSKSSASVSGKIRIVADSAIHIIKILKSFRKNYPDVIIDLTIGNSKEVTTSIRNYDAEIGVIGSPVEGPDLQTLTLETSKIKAIASKKFFNKIPKSLSFQDLEQLPLVFRENGSHTRETLIAEALKQKKQLVPVIEVTGREGLHELVANGLGIGFVSQAEIGQDPRLAHIDIDAGHTEMTETLMYLTARKEVPVIRAFLKAAENL